MNTIKELIFHRPTQAFVVILVAVALLFLVFKNDNLKTTQPTEVTACCSDATGEECCKDKKPCCKKGEEKECCKEKEQK